MAVLARNPSRAPAALALGAHPDDIEFVMAGTLLLLRQAGLRIHYLNLSSGNCGSTVMDSPRLRTVRRREARKAATILGAQFHPSVADDLEIFYKPGLLRRLAAIIREIDPLIILTHSPNDYMEDHTNTCRLAVTASFSKGMPNFKTIPPKPAIAGDVTIYHAMPHGLQDGLRQAVIPSAFVDTSTVHSLKKEALAAHQSQQGWLQKSQGLSSYLETMEQMSRAVGKMSGTFKHAEGWRRHSHLGFSSHDNDPLQKWLGKKYRALNEPRHTQS